MTMSYSRAATLAACPRKYEYGYEQEWTELEVNLPRHAGKVMAQGLYALHDDFGKAAWQKVHGDDDALIDLHEYLCGVLNDAWGDFVTPPGHKHAYLTEGHLESVMWYYIRDRDPWQIEPLKEEEGKILAEKKVTFAWPQQFDGNVEMLDVTGIPDVPAIVAGQRAVVDAKCTTGYVNDWWAKKFSVIGHQLRTYMAMLRHEYGIETKCAYVDGVYMGKTAAQDDYAWRNRSSARSRLFGPFNFTDSQLEETWKWYKTKYAEVEFYRELGNFPQDESSCSNFGGCEFQPLCKIAPIARDARAEQLFRKKER